MVLKVVCEPSDSPAGRAVYRLRQGVAHLFAHHSTLVDAELAAALSPAQFALVARLAPADRAHLLRAGRRAALLSDDPDLRLAAFLHDVGKADGRARVRLYQRTLVVLLGHWAPGLLARLARPSARRWRHGLYLAVAHPRLGAELARAAGAGERACRLIALHQHGPGDDAAVALLRRIDEES